MSACILYGSPVGALPSGSGSPAGRSPLCGSHSGPLPNSHCPTCIAVNTNLRNLVSCDELRGQRAAVVAQHHAHRRLAPAVALRLLEGGLLIAKFAEHGSSRVKFAVKIGVKGQRILYTTYTHI